MKRVLLVLWLIGPAFMGTAQENALGLEATPDALYRSFRASKPNPVPSDAIAEAARTGSGVDLSPWMPQPGFQGGLGSCVTWAAGYAVKTYHENIERGWGAADPGHVFSPSFLYNQITRGRNVGTSFQDSFAILVEDGIASWRTMPYTENPGRMPTAEARQEARQYTSAAFSRVNISVPDIRALLDRGHPVLVGLEVHRNFQDYKGGVYRSVRGPVEGGHAMTVVGYDDSAAAFKLINSWSTLWGEDGFCRIDYELFLKLCREAYVLYDKIEATPQTLATPGELSASRGAYRGRIQLRWQSVPNAGGYRVYRRAPDAEDLTSIGQTLGTTYIDQAGRPEVRYLYAVQAINETRESQLSEIAIGWAASPEPVLPAPPQNLDARIREGQVFLRWDPVEAASAYLVYRWDPDRESYLRTLQSEDAGASEPLPDVPPDSVLHYVVTAVGAGGEGTASDAISVMTPGAPATEEESQPLVPPSRILVDRGPDGRGISLKWEPVPDAQWYIVLRWRDARTDWQILERRRESSELLDLSGRDSDYYMVVSANPSGFSDLSEYVGLEQTRFRQSLAFDDVRDNYYVDPRIDSFFDGEVFTGDAIFPIGDRASFQGQYFDDGIFDDETVMRFYQFFQTRRQDFERKRSERRRPFERLLN